MKKIFFFALMVASFLLSGCTEKAPLPPPLPVVEKLPLVLADYVVSLDKEEVKTIKISSGNPPYSIMYTEMEGYEIEGSTPPTANCRVVAKIEGDLITLRRIQLIEGELRSGFYYIVDRFGLKALLNVVDPGASPLLCCI